MVLKHTLHSSNAFLMLLHTDENQTKKWTNVIKHMTIFFKFLKSADMSSYLQVSLSIHSCMISLESQLLEIRNSWETGHPLTIDLLLSLRETCKIHAEMHTCSFHINCWLNTFVFLSTWALHNCKETWYPFRTGTYTLVNKHYWSEKVQTRITVVILLRLVILQCFCIT